MSKLSNEVRSILACPDRHSATVRFFAEELHQLYAIREDDIRVLWRNREARRAWQDIRRRARSAMARKAEMTTRFDAATYLAVSNAWNRLATRPLFHEHKLAVYLALETASRADIARLHFLLATKDREKLAPAAKEYPDIFLYGPDQVAEILCWRLLAIMPAD